MFLLGYMRWNTQPEQALFPLTSVPPREEHKWHIALFFIELDVPNKMCFQFNSQLLIYFATIYKLIIENSF